MSIYEPFLQMIEKMAIHRRIRLANVVNKKIMLRNNEMSLETNGMLKCYAILILLYGSES